MAVQIAASSASGAPGDVANPYTEFHTTYRLIAKADDSVICVHQKSEVDARVHADFSGLLPLTGWVALPNNGPGDIPDALIHGRAQGDVVKLLEADRVTELHGSHGSKNAIFHFEGQKAGDTQITFEVEPASMSDFGLEGDLTTLPNSVDVRVIHCKFQLHVFSTFLVEGPAGMTFGTAMTNVELTQSDDGQFRQSVDMQWFAWVGRVGDCMGRMATRVSESNVFADLDRNGMLSVDVLYEPFHIKLSGNCGGFETDLTPSPLHFEVDSRGGSGSQAQSLSSPLGGASGAASWVIVPTDGGE